MVEQMRNEYELSAELLSSIVDLAKRCHVRKLILFGSRARQTHRIRSDIDLAVLGGDAAYFSATINEEVPTLLSFDVVNLNGSVQPELLREIEKDGVILYEED